MPSLFSLNATFSVVFSAVLTQICMTLKVVVYLSGRRVKSQPSLSSLTPRSKNRSQSLQKRRNFRISLAELIFALGESPRTHSFPRATGGSRKIAETRRHKSNSRGSPPSPPPFSPLQSVLYDRYYSLALYLLAPSLRFVEE